MDEQDIQIALLVDEAFRNGDGEPEAYEKVAKLFNIANVQVVIDCYEDWLTL